MTSVTSPSAGRVRLRPLQASDRAAIRRWMADMRVIAFTVVVPGPDYGPVEPYDAAAADRYLELLLHEPGRCSHAILLDGEHVGNVGLKHIDSRRGTSECFIEIGEVSARRRGVALAAMSQLLDVAFDELQLQTVRLGVFEFNAPAIGLYRKLGFVDDGRLGDHYAGGRVWAVNAMRIDALGWYRVRGRLGRLPAPAVH
jgi:RimJ/RimL family protein N-acetyltransferase